MKRATAQKKVIIVGGGFAGVAAAKQLAKDPLVSVTLVTRQSYFEYYPALYKLVTGALAIEVCVPYEKIFSGTAVQVLQGIYQSYDATTQTVTLEGGATLHYDYLILAPGSEVNYFNIPGIEQYAFAFKSAEQALALKQHLCGLFEESENVPKDALVERFHVTVVGGGPSGVELAGDLTTYLRRKARRYHIDPSLVTVDLIESNPRVLRMLPESVSKKVEARLRKLKVNMYMNRTLKEQDVEEVIASGMTLRSGTVIWTAGTRLNSALSTLPLNERKLVSVTSSFALPTDEHVFVLGDGAGAPGSGLAQGAITHGVYAAKALSAHLRGKTVTPYKARTMGYAIPVGHRWAVFSYKSLTVSGYLPWLFRSVIDFHYFTTIVPLSYVFTVFRQGAKYRKS